MKRTILNQALSTIKGEVLQKGDGLALSTEDGLIDLETARGRLLPLTTGTCAILSGYPRFDTRSGKVQSLAITGCGFCTQRSPGELLIAGQIFAVGDGLIIVQVAPKYQPAFFVPVQGYLTSAREGEYWRLECQLEEGLATLVDCERLREVPEPPKLKRHKTKAKKLREKTAV